MGKTATGATLHLCHRVAVVTYAPESKVRDGGEDGGDDGRLREVIETRNRKSEMSEMSGKANDAASSRTSPRGRRPVRLREHTMRWR